MEGGFKKESGTPASKSGFDIVESIKTLAARNARAKLDNDETMLLFLQSWWSRTYNRPLKDPLLLSYTLEELLYEFYDRIERAKAAEEQLEEESDKIEEEKEKGALDWAEAEEKRELEAAQKAESQKSEDKPDPTKDPENIRWMEEQIQKAKTEFGESFGEDIDENF
jgi:hypothetical protein